MLTILSLCFVSTTLKLLWLVCVNSNYKQQTSYSMASNFDIFPFMNDLTEYVSMYATNVIPDNIMTDTNRIANDTMNDVVVWT